MSTGFAISELSRPPSDFEVLLEESRRQGIGFLQRLGDEWESGANRFSLPGEALFEIRCRSQLVGICGLNRDPYANDASIGRLRHLYVAIEQRRNGAGRRLVQHVLRHAQARFGLIRLRAESAEADLFYRALGFSNTKDQAAATHELWLPDEELPARSSTAHSVKTRRQP
jgi:N-acetylglutamate synthase-like GNAT family acetyltransferase